MLGLISGSTRIEGKSSSSNEFVIALSGSVEVALTVILRMPTSVTVNENVVE